MASYFLFRDFEWHWQYKDDKKFHYEYRENIYITSPISMGTSTRKIILQHILPNILAPIIILFSLTVPSMILNEAGLSFLGFGIPPPQPSWGGMSVVVLRNICY